MNYTAIIIVLLLILLWVASTRNGPIKRLKNVVKNNSDALVKKVSSGARIAKAKISEYGPGLDEPNLNNPPACYNKKDTDDGYMWERTAATYDDKKGEWQCDFFDLGSKRFPEPQSAGPVQAGDPHILCLSKEKHDSADPTQGCGWGTFNPNSLKSYDIGSDADSVVSGYRLVPIKEDQEDNLFKRYPNIDATLGFSGPATVVAPLTTTADDVDQCEARCAEPYDYINGSSNALGCYGYVYDPTTTTCDIYRTANKPVWGNSRQLRGDNM